MRDDWFYDNNSDYCCDHKPLCKCWRCCQGFRSQDAARKIRDNKLRVDRLLSVKEYLKNFERK